MMTTTLSSFQVLSSVRPDLRVRNYKRLRTHKKSTSGCLPCKVKKVKCDECRPICERCQRNGRRCAYGNASDGDSKSPKTNLVAISELCGAIKVTYSCPAPQNGAPSLRLLHHFYTNWDEIFDIPGRDELASLSQSSPLVRNTVLAITACHLRHVSHGVLEHRIAEHFHQSLAIKDLQKALETPRKLLGQQGVNSMLLSAFLLNMIAFTLPHQEDDAANDPSSSWVFSSCKDRLGWLALMAGLRPLLISLSAYLEQTVVFLDPIMFGHRQGGWTDARRRRGLDIVPESWIRAFGLKNDSSSCDSNADADPNDVLRPAAIALAYLRGIDPLDSKVFLNLMFLTKVHGDFRSLLKNKDERALWLFGYWLGLMCRYEGIWWCERRVRRDYEAVRMWLDTLHLSERPGDEGLCWKHMMRELELAPAFMREDHQLLAG